jgi:hypothetical protein
VRTGYGEQHLKTFGPTLAAGTLVARDLTEAVAEVLTR